MLGIKGGGAIGHLKGEVSIREQKKRQPDKVVMTKSRTARLYRKKEKKGKGRHGGNLQYFGSRSLGIG